MKANIVRVISLLVVVFMITTAFAACKKNVETDTSSLDSVTSDATSDGSAVNSDTGYYTIAEGNAMVVQVLNDDGTDSLHVLEGTTVEQFFSVVTPVSGYALKIFNADNTEVTDTAAVIAEGMLLKVVMPATESGGEDTEIETVTLVVVTQQQFESDNKPKTGASGAAAAQTALTGYNFNLGSVRVGQYYENSNSGNIYKSQIQKIEKTYNCKVNYLTYNGDADQIVKEVAARNCQADVIELNLEAHRNVAKRGACLNIFSTSIDKNAYNTGMTDSCTYGSNVYGVAFDAIATKTMGVIYNKDIVKKYYKGDINTLYKQNKWDFDAFEAVAKACTQDTDGDGTTDIFGVASNTNIIGMAITANAGGTATRTNGKISATMCSQAGIKALEWCKRLFQNRYWDYTNSIEMAVTNFSNGKAAMFVSNMDYYGTIAANADFEMGFVLMPMGPDLRQYTTGVYDGYAYMIPANKESTKEASALFLNQLAKVSGRLINETMKNMQRNGLDANSANIYKYSISHTTAEFRTGAISAELSKKVDTSVISKSKDPSAVVDSVKTAMQKELDDFYDF